MNVTSRIKVEVIDLKSLDSHIKDSAAYIAITKVDKQYPIPVINGIAFQPVWVWNRNYKRSLMPVNKA
jgi:hypothetical protein